LFDRICFAGHLTEILRTDIRTFSAQCACLLVRQRFSAFYSDGMFRAFLCTVSTPSTFRLVCQKLIGIFLSLRIVTPRTFQLTSFKKYARADSVSIVDGILLNIRYQWSHVFSPLLYFLLFQPGGFYAVL